MIVLDKLRSYRFNCQFYKRKRDWLDHYWNVIIFYNGKNAFTSVHFPLFFEFDVAGFAVHRKQLKY